MCIIVSDRFIVIILLPEANAYPRCTLLPTHFTKQNENLPSTCLDSKVEEPYVYLGKKIIGSFHFSLNFSLLCGSRHLSYLICISMEVDTHLLIGNCGSLKDVHVCLFVCKYIYLSPTTIKAF